MKVVAFDGKKNSAQLLREVDEEFPDAKAMIILILNDDDSVSVRVTKVTNLQACWMREILNRVINYA